MEQRTADNPKDWDKPVNVNQPDQKFEAPENNETEEAHPVVMPHDALKASGKRSQGTMSEDIISVHSTSTVQDKRGRGKRKWDVEPKVIHDIGDILVKSDFTSTWPQIEDLEVGSGLFIETEPNQTIDQLMIKVDNEVLRLNTYWSVPYHNENGEEVLDQVTVKYFKRNSDDTIQLDGDDTPITGANFEHLLRRVQIRQYVARSVTPDDHDKIDDDGALIVRVF